MEIVENKKTALTTTKQGLGAVDQAITDLHLAFASVRRTLSIYGVSGGDLTLSITLQGAVAEDKAKHTLRLSHHHYKNFNSGTKTSEGLEWDETRREFLRVLDRDQRLLRLTAQSEEG